MISAYHLRKLMSAWEHAASSARTHRASPEANLFSRQAARDVEIVVDARRELAGLYLSRIERTEAS